MKHQIVLAIVLLIVPALLCAQEAPKTEPAAGTLTVRVTGLKSDQGEVRMALNNSEAAYADEDAEPFRALALPIHDRKAEAVFEHLPFGDYTIKLFHDQNSNGELDTILGLPSEDYGFSNNARATFGPPKYKKAKFDFKAEEMTIEIVISPTE